MSISRDSLVRKSTPSSNETTPLLIEVAPEPLAPGDAYGDGRGDIATTIEEQQDEEEEEEEEEEETALPKTQIFLLCFAIVAGPIAFFSIFPYVNFMIEKVGGIDKEDVGFYSGLIESLFSATQMCVMVFWGKASDRWGRKPVLVVSLMGMSIATTLFGMSRTLWQMVLFRCTAGVFAGTVVTVRAMLSELSTKHTQARAFSFFSFAYNLGIFIGPLLGGALETPVDKYPSLLGGIQFFHDYPYVLPNMVISGIAFLAAITTIFFVNETLPQSGTHKDFQVTPMSSWKLLQRPGVAKVLLIYNYVMLLAFTFTAVFPVFQYTPIAIGGLGFSSTTIAACTGINGASQSIWLLLVFPTLHRRIGTGRILAWAATIWPIFFMAAPFYHVLLAHGFKAVFWSTGPLVLFLGSSVAMAFTSIQLALNDIAPSHDTLGTLNAIALAIQSGFRAVAPAVATSIYAIGVKYHILGGQLFWIANVVLAVGLWALLPLLPEKAKGLRGRRKRAERVGS